MYQLWMIQKGTWPSCGLSLTTCLLYDWLISYVAYTIIKLCVYLMMLGIWLGKKSPNCQVCRERSSISQVNITSPSSQHFHMNIKHSACLAKVAAPILGPRVLKCSLFRCSWVKILSKADLNISPFHILSLQSINRRLVCCLELLRKGAVAHTGQILWLVRPRDKVMFCWNESNVGLLYDDVNNLRLVPVSAALVLKI